MSTSDPDPLSDILEGGEPLATACGSESGLTMPSPLSASSSSRRVGGGGDSIDGCKSSRKYDGTAVLRACLENEAERAKLRICVDLDFDDILISDRERNSVCKQLSLTYGAVRAGMQPAALHITSLRGRVLDTMRTQGIESWAARLHEEALSDVFPRRELVYLSPDAEKVLDVIDPSKVYVIGGIADRSVKKGVTLKKASDLGVDCVRLPVQEHVPGRQSHVLNINTVAEVLVRHLQSGSGAWEEPVRLSIPQRIAVKGGRRSKRRKRPSGAGEEEDDADHKKSTSSDDLPSQAHGPV